MRVDGRDITVSGSLLQPLTRRTLYAQDLFGRNGVPARDDRTRHVVAKS